MNDEKKVPPPPDDKVKVTSVRMTGPKPVKKSKMKTGRIFREPLFYIVLIVLTIYCTWMITFGYASNLQQIYKNAIYISSFVLLIGCILAAGAYVMKSHEQVKPPTPAGAASSTNIFLKYQMWLAVIIIFSLIIIFPIFMAYRDIEHARVVSEVLSPIAMVVVGFYFGQRQAEVAEEKAETAVQEQISLVGDTFSLIEDAKNVIKETRKEVDVKVNELKEIAEDRDYLAELLKKAVYGEAIDKQKVKDFLDDAKIF